MAFSTPVNVVRWDGTQGQLRYRAVFDGAGQDLTDSAIVDISALAPAPNSVKVQRIQSVINGVYSATLEYDATTDQIIDQFSGQSDISNPYVVDYSKGPNGGVVPTNTAAGFVGDILLTTVGAAAGHELNLTIDFRKKTLRRDSFAGWFVICCTCFVLPRSITR